ncbi:hypothetical protein WOLCODRAFT_136536 [Wolfiporia cocos MD-104 SS10]|uniref:Protein kinase domain-containing protein n=1 Tax=Wolfiporia cocos (strain MD-104) TaxID=742152 RepID=A0A2H3JUR6_WOLCO|nr:hypothetical protein WOLCODRAFT_136536 [Wolfiporia cocos MD-104 SS10]
MPSPSRLVLYYPHPTTPWYATVPVTGDALLASILDRIEEDKGIKIPRLLNNIYAPPDIRLNPVTTVLARAQEWLRFNLHEQGVQIHEDGVVGDIFEGVPNGRIHILIVDEDVEEGLDEVADLAERMNKFALDACEATAKDVAKEPSPSDGVHRPSNVLRQDTGIIHAGRPYLNYGLPPALYNATLARLDFHLQSLDEDLDDLIPDPALVGHVHLFMAASLETYDNENGRQIALRDHLHAIMRAHAEWWTALPGCKPDAIWRRDSFPFVVLELKNESGLEGDATLQAALSYSKIVGMNEHAKWRKSTNVPVILIGLMGDFLEIAGAVFVGGVYPSAPFSQRLGLNFHSHRNVLRVSKAFKAVTIAAAELLKFYSREPSPSYGLAHLFPSPTHQEGDPLLALTFKHRMTRTGKLYQVAKDDQERRSGLFVAALSDADGGGGDNEVIVKFTERYNADAHRLLANSGLAPKLYSCSRVMGGLYMVVMERMKGETAWTLSQRKDGIPYEVYEDVELAISKLHAADLVFGDLRMPNIMCVRGGGDGSKTSGMLLDYDWAGIDGKDRYPSTLNHQLEDEWARGMERYGVMRKEHDREMLEMLRVACQPKLSVA